jgi:hypothetical protein
MTNIGNNAFANCTSITQITLPSTVNSIANNAFTGTTNLTDIFLTAPSPRYQSEGGVLYSDTTLIHYPTAKSGVLTIPTNITSIADYAFYNNTRITAISLNPNVKHIGKYAFYGCHAMLEITGWENVQSIGENAFAYSGLQGTITLPLNLNAIERETFRACTDITEVAIPATVRSIDEMAFYGCSTLASVAIPAGVERIGAAAFFSSALKNITIPQTITFIGERAFANIDSLDTINVEAGNTHYSSTDGILYAPAENTLVQYPAHRSGDFIIPNNITTIGNSAFMGCTNVANVILPATLTNIGSNAFEGCAPNYALNMHGAVPPTIGYNAFINPPSRVEVPACAAADYKLAQGWKDILSSITPLSNIACTHWKCGDNVYATMNYSDSTLVIKGNGAMFDYQFSNLRPWDGVKDKITSVHIENGVTTSSAYTFNGMSKLRSVDIPASTTTIGVDAFAQCPNLTQIRVDAQSPYYSLHEGILYNKNHTTLVKAPVNIKEIVVPAGVSSIATYAFAYSALQSITLPPSVVQIGEYAFAHCDSLVRIYNMRPLPQTITNNVFYGINKTPIHLLVIDDTIATNAYKTEAVWSGFVIVEEVKQVRGIILSPLPITLRCGATYQLSAIIIPLDAADQTITWTSSDPYVATVDASGKITASKWNNGTAVITATSNNGGHIAACTVTIIDYIPAVDIALSETNITLAMDDTMQLTATILPDSATYRYARWSSDNPDIAEISSTGILRGIFPGSTIVYATTHDGKHSNYCIVQVVLSTSVDMPDAAQPLRIYPNPTNDVLIIDNTSSPLPPNSIEIYTLSGTLVSVHSAFSLPTILRIKHLPAGIYIIKAGSIASKFVKY